MARTPKGGMPGCHRGDHGSREPKGGSFKTTSIGPEGSRAGRFYLSFWIGSPLAPSARPPTVRPCWGMGTCDDASCPRAGRHRRLPSGILVDAQKTRRRRPRIPGDGQSGMQAGGEWAPREPFGLNLRHPRESGGKTERRVRSRGLQEWMRSKPAEDGRLGSHLTRWPGRKGVG